jgi:hypothetical protein
MTYMGDWGKLQNNMDKLRAKIAEKKSRQPSIKNSGKRNKAALNRKPMSLVAYRKNQIRKIRLFLVLVFIVALILMSIYL